MESTELFFAFDSLCGGESILNTSQIWHHTPPIFNRCFQQTVPVLLPSVVLWIGLPLNLRSLGRLPTAKPIPYNGLNLSRLLAVFFIVAANVVQLARLRFHLADLSSPLVNVFNFTLLGILLHQHRLHGIHTSAFVMLFTFLSTLLTLPSFYMFMFFASTTDYLESFTFLVHFTSLAVLFALTCFADHHQPSPASSPIERVSILSVLTYWWVNSLMALCYRRTVTLDDLWPLQEDDSTEVIAPQFDQHWNREQQKAPKNAKQKRRSLIWTLACTFKTEFFLGALSELLLTFFVFVNPQLLKILLRFISTPTDLEPLWHGYFIAILLFLSSSCLSFSRTYIDHIMFSLRLRIRSALLSAIYRKSLSLSTAARSQATTGEMINYMSTDAEHIVDVITEIHSLWSAPLMGLLAVYFLWIELGPAMLAGIAVMLLIVPFTTIVSEREHRFRDAQMEAQDERVKVVTEVLGAIKVVKLHGWEVPLMGKIEAIRENEVKQIADRANLGAITSIVWTSASFAVSLASFAAWILSSEENVLDPAKAFVSLALFEELRFPMTHIPEYIAQIITALVSVKRVETFLNSEELEKYVTREEDEKCAIKIEDGTFKWEKGTQKATLAEVTVRIPRGSLVAVVGHVGAGKSSLLSAILGDMERVEGGVNVARGESVAYVAQQAWIRNATLRENVLFGAAYEKKRYEAIIEMCALKPDLAILPGGDQTEIGEKGINLSGGQKQRVALARACYQASSIVLLDDPLAAVDSHVARHIFTQVLHSTTGYLRDRTRVLVTNNIQLLPEVDQIFVLESGRIRETGTYSQLMANSGKFADFIKEHSSDVPQDEDASTASSHPPAASFSRQASHANPDDSPSSGQLMSVEHIESGRVAPSVYLTYFRSCTWPYFALTVLAFAATEAVAVASDVWLACWSNDGAQLNDTDLRALRNYRLGGYGLLAVAQTVFIFIAAFALAKTNVASSTKLHRALLQGIMHSPMKFFDTTPLGRIVNRFSKDIDTVDTDLSFNLDNVLTALLGVLSNLGMICFKIPHFLLVILPTSVIYFGIQKFYLCAYCQLSRIKSTTRSPIYGHFGESIAGVSTIRAFGALSRFVDVSNCKIDTFARCYYAKFIITRWLALRLESLGNVLVLFASIFALMARDRLDPGFVGLLVAYSLGMVRSLKDLVWETSEMETNVVSVERIAEYCQLEAEAEWTRASDVQLPDGWPTKGTIELVDYSVRYRPGLELVLKNVSVKISAGMKAAVVGRTGSGKTTLSLALFRILEAAEGQILIDGIDTATLGLHQLRQRLAIIPQDPMLFSGTIRSNLDSFGVHRDELLLKALDQCHLRHFVDSTELGLEQPVAENGSNLSVGQRQLLCLGRALLQRARILVMDEATGSIDLQTDALIQETIRREFAQCTVLTIAHRLHTIIDSDRVMVLDGGQVVEFDSPASLLANHESQFYSLAKDAGIV